MNLPMPSYAKMTLREMEAYNKGYNDAMDTAAKIVLSIDSNRGNEKEIAKAIEARKFEMRK